MVRGRKSARAGNTTRPQVVTATPTNAARRTVLGFCMNVNTDWAYLVKYECGRKDPDFEKFCGWQSGLALTLGR